MEVLTQRFLLRRLTVDDVSERYLSWLDDSSAQKYIVAAGNTRGIDDLRNYVAARQQRDDLLFLGIFDRETGRHIGNIKYEPMDCEAGYAVMGILIGEPDYRGKGVTSEVLTASAQWLKQRYGLSQILLGVDLANEAAIRAYQKVGFVVEDTPHIDKVLPGTVTMVWRI